MSSWNPVSFLACAFAFLSGSIPFGILVARIFKVRDLTSQGSGNIGATNVARVIGFWPAGALTLFLDLFKGMMPVFLVMPIGAQLWSRAVGFDGFDSDLGLVWAVGLCAVLGHCYSPWLHFRGGKGVATGLGAILLLSPWAALGGVIGFASTFLFKRTGSLASLAGLLVVSMTHLVLHPLGPYLWFGAAMIFTIVLRHEGNIDALLEGKERTF